MRLVLALVILGAIEGVGWIADASAGFHDKLTEALKLMEVHNQPVGLATTLPWPGVVLMVRAERDRAAAPEEYWVGRRRIPDADTSSDMQKLYPPRHVGGRERRIFVIGGSAAFGYAYPYSRTFSAELNRTLGPGGTHVYNAAKVGWESGEHAPIVQRIVEHHEAHTLIIFTGNNEWLRWRPSAQPPLERASVRALRVLAHSRAAAGVTYLMLRRNLDQMNVGTEHKPQHVELSGLQFTLANPLPDEAFDPRRWHKVKLRYLDNFEGNLVTMIDQARRRGIRVIICTMPMQYKLSPAWKHPQPDSFDPRHREAVRKAIGDAVAAVSAGDESRVLEIIDGALALDPLPPVLHYLRARALEGLGRPAEAETAYAQCRENMIGNLGGMLSINRVIRRVAKNTGVTLVDVKKIFDDYEHAHGRYFNQNLVHDDCHPTPEGHQVIAGALMEVLVRE